MSSTAVNRNRAWLTFDFDTLSGEVVQTLAVALEGAEHRGHLRDFALKLGQDGSDMVGCDIRGVGLCDDLAHRVVGVGGYADKYLAAVPLCSVQEVLHNAGRRTEAYGNDAGRDGIESARRGPLA